MNIQENNYLIQERQSEGKSKRQIYEELLNFKASQIKFKKLEKENKDLIKKVKSLTQQVNVLDIKLNKQNNEKLISGLGISVKKDKIESKTQSSASILMCSRIIKFMEINIPYTKTDMANNIGVKPSHVEECINFLMKYTNIKIEKKGDRYIKLE
jgi:hypothetical protein